MPTGTCQYCDEIFDVKDGGFVLLTPTGMVHFLYWIGTSGEQRGIRCMSA